MQIRKSAGRNRFYSRGEIESSSKAIRARTAGSRSPSLLERRMVSAIDLIRAEPTGWGSVERALSIAFAMVSIVSGGNDACEKSFTRSNVDSDGLIGQALQQRRQMRRYFNGSLIQTRAKPFTDFLADRCAMEAADLSVSLVSAIRHENPIVPENAEGKCLPTGSHKTGFPDVSARAGPLQAGCGEVGPNFF